MQVVNWDKYHHTGMMDFDLKTLSDGRTFHREYRPTPDGSVIFHTEFRKDEQIQASWADHLYPKLAEDLKLEMQKSGFDVTAIFGDFQKSPFDPISSPATIFVAQKLSKP